MKVISTLNNQLVQEKEKELKILTQVVDAKSKVVAEQKSIQQLHQNLLETSDKAFAETLQIEKQQKDIQLLKNQMMNQTVQMKMGQKEMEKELKIAVEDSKKIGYAEGAAQQKEFYRLANEQESLVQ
jgi:hypothetical protein